jgi:hypothetical protein
VAKKTKNGRGGPGPGSGRKPLPPGERKDQRAAMNLTESELDDLLEDAGELSISDFLRGLWLRWRRRRRASG